MARKDRVLALVPAVVIVGVAVGLLKSEDRGVGLVVMGVGLGAVLVGTVTGKPERVFGLTERLLHLLPEPVWRVVITLLGLAIMAMGLWALLDL